MQKIIEIDESIMGSNYIGGKAGLYNIANAIEKTYPNISVNVITDSYNGAKSFSEDILSDNQFLDILNTFPEFFN